MLYRQVMFALSGHNAKEIFLKNSLNMLNFVGHFMKGSSTMVFTGGGRGLNNDSFNTVRISLVAY